jgi:hypothetical protein
MSIPTLNFLKGMEAHQSPTYHDPMHDSTYQLRYPLASQLDIHGPKSAMRTQIALYLKNELCAFVPPLCHLH